MNDPTEENTGFVDKGKMFPVYDPSLKPKCAEIPATPFDIAERGGMNIGPLKVQPMLLYLPENDYWVKRWKDGMAHFEENGLKNIIQVPGIHGRLWGVSPSHTYDVDNPGTNFFIGQGYMAQFLSVYVMYNVAAVLPFDHFLFLECDARLKPDFLHHAARELENIPPDFDWCWLGHCCAQGKLQKHVKGNVYQFDQTTGYPFAGHCFIVARKALPFIMQTQRDTYASSDLSLCFHTFPHLKTFGIVPRLADQFNTDLAL